MNTQKGKVDTSCCNDDILFLGLVCVKGTMNEVPGLYKQFLLASFITIIAAWLANIYYKVSLHALAMGGLVAFTCYISLWF